MTDRIRRGLTGRRGFEFDPAQQRGQVSQLARVPAQLREIGGMAWHREKRDLGDRLGQSVPLDAREYRGADFAIGRVVVEQGALHTTCTRCTLSAKLA